MRIEPRESTGRAEPQFVVTAETDAERLLLKQFTEKWWDDGESEFHLHGWGYNSSQMGVQHFNFGWIEALRFELQTQEAKVLALKRIINKLLVESGQNPSFPEIWPEKSNQSNLPPESGVELGEMIKL